MSIPGYTAMCEPITPKQVAGVLDAYYTMAAATIRQLGGMVVEYAGDRVTAVWNVTQDHDNHALLAIETGIRMVGESDTMNRDLRSRELPPIRYGIGIETGDAAVGHIGGRDGAGLHVMGDTPNRAVLLSEVAGGGEIIVGEGARIMAGDHVDAVDCGLLKLGARKTPLRAFSVTSLK